MMANNPPRGNPFSEQGVSKYPPVAPLVGQIEVHERIQDMLDVMGSENGSCFRAIFGDWGIGKTRLAHELVAEICGKSRGWIIRQPDGKVDRTFLLGSLQETGILPIFTTFADVLKSPEEGIDLRSALAKAVCVALEGMAKSSGRDFQVKMANDIQQAITLINPGFDFDELGYLASNESTPIVPRANNSFKYLQNHAASSGEVVIKKLLVIIDEIETVSEFTPANTAEEKRVQEYPIEAIDIKTLFSAIKEEAGQSTLPNISFLLLCSPGVRRVASIEANARRLKEATLEKATGEDLMQLLDSLKADGYLSTYPGDLPQSAFLAADRNFGWFSYIMYPVYRRLYEGKVDEEDYDVLRQVSTQIGKTFKSSLINDLNESRELKDRLARIVYHQIPASLSHLGISEDSRQTLIEFNDPFGIKVVGEVFISQITRDDLIRDLRASDYKEEDAHSIKLVGEGSTFDPSLLLSKFSTYASNHSNCYLIFTSSSEFPNQVRFLTNDELTDKTILTIHQIFQKYRVKSEPILLAPTVTFLLKFNERWASSGVRAWLSDLQWENLEKMIKDLSTTEARLKVCQGISKVLFDSPPRSQTLRGVSSPYLCLKLSDGERLSVTKESAIAILYASDVNTVIQDLKEIYKNTPIPVLLLFSSDEKLTDWRHELVTSHLQHLAALAITRVVEVGNREYEFLQKYSYRDENPGFPSGDVRERGRDQRSEYRREWERAIEGWFKYLEEQGYLLQPLVDQTAKFPNLKRAYPLLAEGKNKNQIAAMEGGGPLLTTIDTLLMQIASGNILKIFADNTGALFFSNVFARILDITTIPHKSEEIADKLFYKRPSGSGFTGQKTASVVVEQILELLEEIGLVEKADGNRYQTVDTQRLGGYLTKARNELGDFSVLPSGFVKDVRNLSAPFKQLAFQLKVNEDQLKLLQNDLVNASERLPSLNLDTPKIVPADQQAFLSAASSVRSIRSQAAKVFREPAENIPPIDPQTLSANIQTAAADTEYQSYSVDYRVRFLKDLSTALEEKRRIVQALIHAINEKLIKSYSHNSDGSGFPIRPLESLLNQASQDLAEQDIILESDLLTPEISANLKNYMMAGELDKAFQRISLYTNWFGDTYTSSYTNQFVRAHTAWQSVIIKSNDLKDLWKKACEYFEADPDKIRWVNPELEIRQEEVTERVANFDHEFLNDYPKPRIKDLQDEVIETETLITSLIEDTNLAIVNGQNEIKEEINKTTYSALVRLAERLGKPLLVSDNIVLSEKRHIDQHQKVTVLAKQAQDRGIQLLGDENLYNIFVDIFKNGQNHDGEYWKAKYGIPVLEELQKKKAIDLKMEIKVNV